MSSAQYPRTTEAWSWRESSEMSTLLGWFLEVLIAGGLSFLWGSVYSVLLFIESVYRVLNLLAGVSIVGSSFFTRWSTGAVAMLSHRNRSSSSRLVAWP